MFPSLNQASTWGNRFINRSMTSLLHIFGERKPKNVRIVNQLADFGRGVRRKDSAHLNLSAPNFVSLGSLALRAPTSCPSLMSSGGSRRKLMMKLGFECLSNWISITSDAVSRLRTEGAKRVNRACVCLRGILSWFKVKRLQVRNEALRQFLSEIRSIRFVDGLSPIDSLTFSDVVFCTVDCDCR